MRVLPEIKVDGSDGRPSMPIEEAHAKIREMASKMDARQRKHAANQMTAGILRIQSEKQSEMKIAQLREQALLSLREWSEQTPVLERNDCARLHNLREAAASRRLHMLNEGFTASEESETCAQYIDSVDQTFVIRHDWARAFESAEEMEGEYNLPYQCCAFEFRISGRSAIIILVDCSLGRQIGVFGQFGDLWLHVAGKNDSSHPLIAFMLSQVRAVCIALDADVATSEVVRAPVKLNEKRAKAGKTPLPDYRVVDLARRHRVANPLASGGSGTKKRLHFRRGHWRHFETSKTWVKWCLVGNPDLGFINKHYRL